MKVIFDCDNTLGLEDRPLDDGLALLHLLATRDVEVLGISTTFGNDSVDKVYEASKAMLKELSLDYKVYKGSSLEGGPSPASDFLVDMANKYPGQVSLVAVGSQRNLYEAYKKDREFFSKLKEVILMGGLTRPLIIKGKKMDELNFSCDREASYHVLNKAENLTIMSGHIGLFIEFSRETYKELEKSGQGFSDYIIRKSKNWSQYVNKNHKRDEFYIWDLAATVYLTNREVFSRNIRTISPSREDLKKGFLRESSQGNRVNIPEEIIDIDKFWQVTYEAWRRGDQ